MFEGEVSLTGGRTLQNIDLHEILAESKLCTKLYPEFAGVHDLVSGLFTARNSFMEKYPDFSLPQKMDLTKEEVKQSFLAGLPLITDVAFDVKALKELSAVLSLEIIKKEPTLKVALSQFQSYLEETLPAEEGTVSLKDIQEILQESAEKTPLKRDLTTFLFSILLPPLFAKSYDLPSLDTLDASLWGKGDCPVCGEKPHYGLLQEDGGKRVLECWLCSFRWEYPRLMCPYCQNADQDKLGLFTVDSSEKYRIHFCRKCTNYIKVYDMRASEKGDAFLPVHNLATLSCDVLALKEGFTPGSGLQWVNEEELNYSGN